MTAPDVPVFAVRADAAKVTSARRWNAALTTGAVTLFVLAVAGIALMVATGFGSWYTIGLVALLAALAVVNVFAARSRSRMLRLLTAGDATLRADGDGLVLSGLGRIGWAELEFVCVTNDRDRTAQLKRVPVIGWAGRAALRAGSGTILCEIAVRDGEALRARAMDAVAASRVTLYPRWPDGHRRGTVPLLLDAVYDDLDTQAVVKILFAYATEHAVPHALFERMPAAITWKGPYLDDVIAGARPR